VSSGSRHFRRIPEDYQEAYQEYGIDGLLDRRTSRPSRRRIPYNDVEKILKLFREEYFDFNVKHFHEKLVEDHGIEYSYT
jgi:hypothetical protein